MNYFVLLRSEIYHLIFKNIAALENANYGACFGSGVAAIDCLLKILNPNLLQLSFHLYLDQSKFMMFYI